MQKDKIHPISTSRPLPPCNLWPDPISDHKPLTQTRIDYVVSYFRDVHPDPSPIWFPSEDHYNKFSFQLSFEEYLRKYSAEQSKSNEEQLIKDGKDSSQPKQGKIALESKTEDKASEIKKVEIKVKDEEIPQTGHSDHIKGLNGTKKSNKANTQESFALIFPQLAWPYPCSSSITKKEQQFYMENFFKYRQQNPKIKSDSMILSKLKVN